MIDLEVLAGMFYSHWWREVGGTTSGGEDVQSWENFRADPKKKRQSNAWVEVARLAAVKVSQRVEGKMGVIQDE